MTNTKLQDGRDVRRMTEAQLTGAHAKARRDGRALDLATIDHECERREAESETLAKSTNMFYLLNVETNTYSSHVTREAAAAAQDPRIHTLIACGSAQAVAIDFAKPEVATDQTESVASRQQAAIDRRAMQRDPGYRDTDSETR